MGMTDVRLLAELHTELKGLRFASSVTNIVVERLQELTPGNGGIQFLRFPASAESVPQFPSASSLADYFLSLTTRQVML
jgi:hypothetical protein